jgi:crotonobetainyl-CoA:carnitine CoA-transferase CaiB-like acyl-CoA transferase
LSVPEVLGHAHLAEREFIREFSATGTEASQRVTRAGFRLHDADTAPASPAPTLGAHTDATLASLGYDEQRIAQLRAEGVI